MGDDEDYDDESGSGSGDGNVEIHKSVPTLVSTTPKSTTTAEPTTTTNVYTTTFRYPVSCNFCMVWGIWRVCYNSITYSDVQDGM